MPDIVNAAILIPVIACLCGVPLVLMLGLWLALKVVGGYDHLNLERFGLFAAIIGLLAGASAADLDERVGLEDGNDNLI